MGRKRKLIFDTPLLSSDEEDQNPPNIRIRDTLVNILPSGRMSAHVRHVDNPASPSKKSRIPREGPVWLEHGPQPEVSLEDYPFLDPDYEHFLDDTGDGNKRARTASVSTSFLIRSISFVDNITGSSDENMASRARLGTLRVSPERRTWRQPVSDCLYILRERIPGLPMHGLLRRRALLSVLSCCLTCVKPSASG